MPADGLLDVYVFTCLRVYGSNMELGEIYMKIWMKSARLIYIQKNPFGSFCVEISLVMEHAFRATFLIEVIV